MTSLSDCSFFPPEHVASATTHLIYVPSSAAFAVTGDVAEFSANFGDAYPAVRVPANTSCSILIVIPRH